jgi:hypothetical protein
MAHYDPKKMIKYMYIELELLYEGLTQHLTIFQLFKCVEKTLSTPKKTLSTPKKTPDMLLDTDTINIIKLYLNTGRMDTFSDDRH